MTELNEHQERVLIGCLRALDEGATPGDCLARYPDEADALRPYLNLRARLQQEGAVEPAAAAYQAGRQALLARVAAAPDAGTPLVMAAGIRWRSAMQSLRGWLLGGASQWQPALARAAAVMAVVAVVGGGALGASAAAGFDPARQALSPARNVLEAFRIIDERDEPAERSSEPDAADEGGRDGDAPAGDGGGEDSDAPGAGGDGGRDRDETDATAEAQDEEPAVAPCRTDERDPACADRPAATETPVRDSRPTDAEPTRRIRPTATPTRPPRSDEPVHDEPVSPDVRPTQPRTDVQPTATPTRPLRSDEPVRDEPVSPDVGATEPATDLRPTPAIDVAEPTATSPIQRDEPEQRDGRQNNQPQR